MRIRKIPVLLVLIICPSFLWAQNSRRMQKKQEKKEKINEMMRLQEEGVIAYQKSFAFGVKLTTDGYGMSFEWGRAQSINKMLLFQLEISERKNHKETKIGSLIPYGTSLTYGKINFVYPLKIGLQQQFLLGNKSNRNGVSITGNVGGGLSLALLRPYYEQVADGMGGLKYIKYESKDSTQFLDDNILVAGPPLSKGWNEIKVVPGAYTKAGLRFDYGRFNELVSAIEVGLHAEMYTKTIPQLVLVDRQRFFYGAYVTILFGKRK